MMFLTKLRYFEGKERKGKKSSDANGILPENKEDNFLLLPPKKFECVKCEYKTHKKGALKEHVGHVFD